MFTSFRLRLRNFINKNKRIILLILIIWLLILIANSALKNIPEEVKVETSYEKHESIMGTGDEVPDELQNPIADCVDTYFKYCNSKQYEAAYNMLSDECKSAYFETLDVFQEYIDIVFNEEKVYYIQNYSNQNGYYIYRMRIMQDLLKTGLTGEDDISYYEEKIVVQQKEDGTLKLGIREFIATENLDDIYEDDYLKIWIEKRDIFYEQELYTIKIKNKSEYIAVLADGTENYEILLKVGTQNREALNDRLYLVIQPGQTSDYTLSFSKFFDEANTTNSLIFNAVRILKTYTGLTLSREAEMAEAEKLYSISIPF